MFEPLHKWLEERHARTQRFASSEIKAEMLRQEIEALKQNNEPDADPTKKYEKDDWATLRDSIDPETTPSLLDANPIDDKAMEAKMERSRRRDRKLDAKLRAVEEEYRSRTRLQDLEMQLSAISKPAQKATRQRNEAKGWWDMMEQLQKTRTLPGDAEQRVKSCLEWMQESMKDDRKKFWAELRVFRIQWSHMPWEQRRKNIPIVGSYVARYAVFRAMPRRIQLGSARMLLRMVKK